MMRMLALGAVAWLFYPIFVCSVGPMGGVKNDAITRIVVPAHAQQVLPMNGKFSPLHSLTKYVSIDGDHRFTFEQMLSDAELVHAKLAPIMRSLYFRIFRVNLDSPCPLRERNDICSHGNDGVADFENDANGPLESGECIPKCYVGRCQPHEVSSSSTLQTLEHFVLRYSEDDKFAELDLKDLYANNHWYTDILGIHSQREDKPVYVDLLHNPPSHTGYRGGDDWNQIYDLQCDCGDEVPCDQTEHLFRLISGMQSSVAAWAAWNYKCVNPVAAFQLKSELPRYVSNPDLYAKMLGNYPDRMENMYYAFQALLKTVCRLSPFLTGFANNLGQHPEHGYLKQHLMEFLSAEYDLCSDVEPAYSPHPREVCEPTHTCVSSPQLKHPVLLQKFKGIADIVDCVGCEKCRLHGKLKLAALQIAVRAFGQAEQLVLERNEIVALLHALDYFAQSIIIVHKFDEQQKRQMVLYPLRAVAALLLVIVVAYRKELRRAFCQCSAEPENREAETTN